MIYDDVIKSTEFKSLLTKYGYENVTSELQAKRCNIQIKNATDIFVIYYNGTLRTQPVTSDRLGKISNPPTGWPSTPTIKDILSLINKVDLFLNKRQDRLEGRIKKLAKKPDMVFDLIFEPYNYTNEFGHDHRGYNKLDFDKLYRDMFGANKYVKKVK